MKLTQDGNSFRINQKKAFSPIKIEQQLLEIAFEFAYNMCFGEGHHRANRSGGDLERDSLSLFCNTFQGKLAELALHNQLKQKGIRLEKPDLEVHGKGIWDDSDLVANGKKLNVKSGAFFSNLLLLETKDWNEKGEYIPNSKSVATNIYDYFVFVRIKPNAKDISKYLVGDCSKPILFREIQQRKWEFDIAGFCTLKTIKHIISRQYILPKGSLLNGKMKIDAANYYIQCGNLKEIGFLISEIRQSPHR